MENQSHSHPTAEKSKFRRWIDRFLARTHHHYLCELPEDTGFLSTSFLNRFFSGITTEKDQLAVLTQIPANAIIVYAIQYKSYFEYLFYYTRYRREKVPAPRIGMGFRFFLWQPISRLLRILTAHVDHWIGNKTLLNPYKNGFIKDQLLQGRTALFSLIERRGVYRRFAKSKSDPVSHLIEIQKTIDRPIYIVPQLMFFSKKPNRQGILPVDMIFGSEERLGIIRRIIRMLKYPGKVFVEISQPVCLKDFLDHPDIRNRTGVQQSQELRQRLLHQINRHRQSITGPVIKSVEELKESILMNERLRPFMENYSASRNIPIYKVLREADGYIDEIAAKYNRTIINVGSIVVGWFLKAMFEGITADSEGLNRIKLAAQKGPVILIPCHKSHFDYLILSFLLHNSNLPCPHVAAGKNLSFWPLGPLFRGGGAFFIRRTFRGAALYSKVFSEYIHKLLQEGFNIEFFIEGGRSRTGKLILPKLGLLSILLGAYRNGACEDMSFAPIYIGYDQVLEENAYLSEIEGEQKKPENIMQVFKARKVLKKRYGRIYVKFDEPISIVDLQQKMGVSLHTMNAKDQNILIRNLGYRVINAINQVSVVTPYALVACVLLNLEKERFSYEQFRKGLETYMTFLISHKATLADTLVVDPEHAVEKVLSNYVQRKFIEPVSGEKSFPFTDTVFEIQESRRTLLEYYKNNVISFFVPAAYTAMAILKRDAFQFSSADLHADYAFLQDLFKYEFAYDVDNTSEYNVRKCIKAFIDDAILSPHPTLPDTYNLTAVGYKKLNLFAGFLRTYFESYLIVLKVFARYSKSAISNKDRLKKIQSRGTRMFKRGEIQRKESLSKINYVNAVDLFTYNGIKGSEDAEAINLYADRIQEYLSRLP